MFTFCIRMSIIRRWTVYAAKRSPVQFHTWKLIDDDTILQICLKTTDYWRPEHIEKFPTMRHQIGIEKSKGEIKIHKVFQPSWTCFHIDVECDTSNTSPQKSTFTLFDFQTKEDCKTSLLWCSFCNSFQLIRKESSKYAKQSKIEILNMAKNAVLDSSTLHLEDIDKFNDRLQLVANHSARLLPSNGEYDVSVGRQLLSGHAAIEKLQEIQDELVSRGE